MAGELREPQGGKTSQKAHTTSPGTRHAARACPSAVAELVVDKGQDEQESNAGPARAASGRVPHWEGDRGQPGCDTRQERLDRAGPRQLEEEALFVLFDLGGHFAESPEAWRGLGRREGGRVEGREPPGLVEAVGRPREQPA